MTRQEAINWAITKIAWYIHTRKWGKDKRSHCCTYENIEGDKCIAGCCMVTPRGQKGIISELIALKGEDILFPEYRSVFSIKEWQELQDLHDELSGGIYPTIRNRRSYKDIYALGINKASVLNALRLLQSPPVDEVINNIVSERVNELV